MISLSPEWKLSWTLVAASFVGFLFHSMPISALSAYMAPLEAEFGWSRTLLSAGISLGSAVGAFLTPLIGAIVDRFGSRRVVLPGIVLSALSWALLAAMTGEEWQWLLVFFTHAVFNVMIGAVLWTTAVAGTFKSSQGLALGLTLAGATGAHTIIPPLTVFLIAEFGWRMSVILLSGGLGAIAFILCFVFFFDQQDRTRAAAKGQGTKKAKEPEAVLTGLSLSEAARNRALWRVGLSILIIMALTIGFLVHQIEILRSVGVSRVSAGWLAGLAGAMGIVGKVVTGLLLDRFRGNWVGGLTMGAAAVAFALLIGGPASPALIIFAMLVNGYTAGAKLQIASYLTVRYAGMRNFGKIYGVVSSLVAAGAGAGPIIAGISYDMTGSYGQFLTAGVIGLFISAILLFTLPRYPDWSRPAQPLGEPALAKV
ncbi:MAG: MFS transporter [Sphingomonadaceae bacterium]|nr:MFS transporter [Sphingomonadaceae bacterium]